MIMDRNNWQLYKDNNHWYWNAWDDVNKRWWISDPFEDYDDARQARDSMMSDSYQEQDTTPA